MSASQPIAHASTLPGARIHVLLVDDSPVARLLLSTLIDNDPRLSLVGVVHNGEEAVEAAARLQPDVIVMDIHMPKLNGFEAARRIMETCPTRIVMVTASTDPNELASTFAALEAGALTVLAKPAGPGDPAFKPLAAAFTQAIKLMSEVPVVRRWPRANVSAATPSAPLCVSPRARVRVVALGASTGGPVVLRDILTRLPKDFPVPLLIVQHISAGFTDGFAAWLAQASGFPVRVARHNEPIQPGMAYIAPDGLQMQLLQSGKINLVDAPAEHSLKPSVSFLFRSIAANFGPAAIGVLLTGMGRDGAQELKNMHDAGAVTIAQDADSSIVFGMPGEAIKLGAADFVLAAEAIAATLSRLVARPPDPPGAPLTPLSRAPLT